MQMQNFEKHVWPLLRSCRASARQLTASQEAPSCAKTRAHWTAPWP